MSQLRAFSPHYNSRLFLSDTFKARSLAMIQNFSFPFFLRLLLPLFCVMCLLSGTASASVEPVQLSGSNQWIKGHVQ